MTPVSARASLDIMHEWYIDQKVLSRKNCSGNASETRREKKVTVSRRYEKVIVRICPTIERANKRPCCARIRVMNNMKNGRNS